MRPMRLLGVALAVVLSACAARADQKPRTPLRSVPDSAGVVVQVHQPKKLWQTIQQLNYTKNLLELESTRELLDSTPARRLFQMVGYFEKELGVPFESLLDGLAGNGACVATKIGEKQPALFVLQGKDAKLMQRFVALSVKIVEQELERQDQKARVEKEAHRGVDVYRVGGEFHFAVVEDTLLASNNGAFLKEAIDLTKGESKASLAEHRDVAEMARVLPKEPLASLWLAMEPIRKQPQSAGIFKTPRDPFFTIVLGGWADVATRSSFLCVGLHKEDNGLLLTVRMPHGRDGMGPDKAVNCPPDGEAGCLPLLEPKGTFFSGGWYYDLHAFWTERGKLFSEIDVKNFEEFDKTSAKFLAKFQFSKLSGQLGARHRFLAVHQGKGGYKKQPKTPVPAFAIVSEMREPAEFSKAMETVLRGLGLAQTFQYGLKMYEETHADCKIVGWRFPEDRELKEDVNDVRFGISPCYFVVGNQFVACSTQELARELVDLLQKEAKSGAKGSPASTRYKLSSSGGIEFLKTFEDQLVASTVLAQAVPFAEAREQVQKIYKALGTLDALTLETTYAPTMFHHDIRLTFKK